MIVEQLEKNPDVIFSHINDHMYFIRESQDSPRKDGERRGAKKIASTNVHSVSIDKIYELIRDDRYALIRISH